MLYLFKTKRSKYDKQETKSNVLSKSNEKKYNVVIFLPKTEVQYRLWSPSIAWAACGTSVAYVYAGSRVRITALSGLTHVRISGRALYLKRVKNYLK